MGRTPRAIVEDDYEVMFHDPCSVYGYNIS